MRLTFTLHHSLMIAWGRGNRNSVTTVRTSWSVDRRQKRIFAPQGIIFDFYPGLSHIIIGMIEHKYYECGLFGNDRHMYMYD